MFCFSRSVGSLKRIYAFFTETFGVINNSLYIADILILKS